MSIQPISSIDYSYLYTSSSDRTSEEIKRRLMFFGLTATGNMQIDLAKLKQVEASQYIQNMENKDDTQFQITFDKPWYEIMRELGLSPTDSPQDDYDKIMDELERRLESASDEDEYEEYYNMYTTVQGYFDEYTIDAQFADYEGINASNMIGASLIANMNLISLNLNQ